MANIIKNLTTNKFYVYGHYRNDTNTLFYVGKGCSNRAWDIRGRNKLWKRIVEKHGYTVHLLYTNLCEQDAFNVEMAIITDLSPQANFTKGGHGGDTYSMKNEVEKEAIRIKKSLAVSGIKHPQFGKTRSLKTRNKIQKSLRHKCIRVKCNETQVIFNSISECAKILKIDKANLQRLRKGKRKSLKGLTFTFLD